MSPRFPHRGETVSAGRATASCFCGAVKMEVAVAAPDMTDVFICHCTDCRKVTSTMFATNFTVLKKAITFLAGADKLTRWSTSASIASGNTMTSSFCSVCGTLMARQSSGSPDRSFLRVGTVDDQEMHDTLLKPWNEYFSENRVAWLEKPDCVAPHKGMGGP